MVELRHPSFGLERVAGGKGLGRSWLIPPAFVPLLLRLFCLFQLRFQIDFALHDLNLTLSKMVQEVATELRRRVRSVLLLLARWTEPAHELVFASLVLHVLDHLLVYHIQYLLLYLFHQILFLLLK